jgi:hypothetical protein
MLSSRLSGRGALGAALLALVGPACASVASQDVKVARSPVFHGKKVDGGTVACSHSPAGLVLTLSDDFVVPDAPAPHWQVVDSRGNAHLLQRLVVKGDALNRSITVPAHVPDVTKVQIWCAFAETLLGETELVCSHDGLAEASAGKGHRSTMFAGPKANTGFVTHKLEGGQSVLVLSDDFVVPDTPAPHWQLVDSRGNVHLLKRLKIAGDAYNQKLVVPGFVADVAKVQIWCAWAETLLGEASFPEAVH